MPNHSAVSEQLLFWYGIREEEARAGGKLVFVYNNYTNPFGNV
jgi:hypothetical protein